MLKLLARTVVKAELYNYLMLFLLLYALIFAWVFTVGSFHLTHFSFDYVIGSALKTSARIEHILPFVLFLSVTQTLVEYANTGQLLAMQLFGYNLKETVLPAVVMAISLSGLLSFLENSYRPDLMSAANQYLCQAKGAQTCTTAINVWGHNSKLIAHITGYHDNNAQGQIILLPNSDLGVEQVIWSDHIQYHDQGWWFEQTPLPINLKPTQLKFSALKDSDQPQDFKVPLPLLFSSISTIFIAYIFWLGLADAGKSSNIIKSLT